MYRKKTTRASPDPSVSQAPCVLLSMSQLHNLKQEREACSSESGSSCSVSSKQKMNSTQDAQHEKKRFFLMEKSKRHVTCTYLGRCCWYVGRNHAVAMTAASRSSPSPLSSSRWLLVVVIFVLCPLAEKHKSETSSHLCVFGTICT